MADERPHPNRHEQPLRVAGEAELRRVPLVLPHSGCIICSPFCDPDYISNVMSRSEIGHLIYPSHEGKPVSRDAVAPSTGPKYRYIMGKIECRITQTLVPLRRSLIRHRNLRLAPRGGGVALLRYWQRLQPAHWPAWGYWLSRESSRLATCWWRGMP
jgi:hypothetical protein